MPLRIGSLFAGYGGLDMGAQLALGGEAAWFCEIDAAPSKVLAYHWPDVPNLGDITAVDWSTVPPVDVLTGGFPCQDVSTAGLRRGLKPGTRSGLWSHFAAAIDALRPPLVIIENVRGLLSAEAHSDVEPDPWDLGEPERGGEPVLRALGAVLGDLADLGYDAEWQGVRAADAGAPHGRFRVFIVARPAGGDPAPRDAEERGRLESATGAAGTAAVAPRGSDRPAEDPDDAASGERRQPAPGEAEGGRPRADPRGRDRAPAAERDLHGFAPDALWATLGGGAVAPADSVRGGRDGRPRHPGWEPLDGATPPGHRASPDGRVDPAGGGAPADPERLGVERRGRTDDMARPAGTAQSPRDQRERDGDPARYRSAAPADTDRDGLGSLRRVEPSEPDPDRRDGAGISWGSYEPAVRRWEAVTGRPAPAPTMPGLSGSQRLSPRFVEWMMGLPDGHVTDPAIGLTRQEQLKALGNGVVPQQAELALRRLLR